MKIVGTLTADPARGDHLDPEANRTPRVLYDGLPAKRALEIWHDKNMQDWRPRPLVLIDGVQLLDFDEDTCMAIDTNQAPWYREPEQPAELTDDQKNMFAAITHGQFDNVVQVPGIFAGAPAAFICMIGPADPSKDSDLEAMENVRFMPLYVQLTEATGPMVQNIGGAALKTGVNPALRTRKANGPLAPPSNQFDAPSTGELNKPTPHRGHAGTPISTGTVADMASYRDK